MSALTLPAALALRPSGELVAIVGGGGKTSLLFALLASLPGRVVATTTTRIFAAQTRRAPAVLAYGADQDLASLGRHLDQQGACLVIGALAGEKAVGVPAHLPGRLLARPDVAHVVVEADGSRTRPVKAPAQHEPVIPTESTVVVAMAGLDALEAPLAATAHRPERVAELCGLHLAEPLTPTALATLLTHREGGAKALPPRARFVVCLNKVGTEARLAAARLTAQLALRQAVVERVLLTTLQEQPVVREIHQRVTGIVLAAGEASRMGHTKQLLPWGQTTVLGQTLEHARRSSLHNTIVVTGHDAVAVREVARAHEVPTVHNPAYAEGEMLSSLQAAVRALPAEVAAALVLLAAQPWVDPPVMEAILLAYRQGHGPLIAPVHDGRRGNPVLIDRRFFAELLSLPPGEAPRSLLTRHPEALHLVAVESDGVLRDLDRPEDYARWWPSSR